jgi:hypothetical protein
VPGEADALLAGFKMQPEKVVSAAYRDLVGVDGFALRPTGKFKGDYQYFELASGGAPERLVTPARGKPLAFRNGKRLVGRVLPRARRGGRLREVARLRLRRVGAHGSGVRAEQPHRLHRRWPDPVQLPRVGGHLGRLPPLRRSLRERGDAERLGDPSRHAAAGFVAPNLVTLISGPIENADPWLPAGATETNGNNVDAYSNTVPPDGFTPVNPGGGLPTCGPT